MKKLYLYDCAKGQALVLSPSIHEAYKKSQLSCGERPFHIREASTEDIQRIKNQGGIVPHE